MSWKTAHAYGYGNLAEILDELAGHVREASSDLVG